MFLSTVEHVRLSLPGDVLPKTASAGVAAAVALASTAADTADGATAAVPAGGVAVVGAAGAPDAAVAAAPDAAVAVIPDARGGDDDGVVGPDDAAAGVEETLPVLLDFLSPVWPRDFVHTRS